MDPTEPTKEEINAVSIEKPDLDSESCYKLAKDRKERKWVEQQRNKQMTTDEALKISIPSEEREELIKKLKDSELLHNIKFELDKDHIEDYKAKMFIFLDCCSSRLKPSYRFSSALTGNTSEGKTNLWKTIRNHLPEEWYMDLTRITGAALEDDTHEYNLFYFGESGANESLIEQIKQIVEDGMDVLKKDKRNDCKTSRREQQDRKVGLYSTTKNPKDKELRSRYCVVSVHGSESKYRKVNEDTLFTAADFIKELDRDERKSNDSWVKKSLRILQEYDVINIPYAPLFEVNCRSSRSQRDLKRFLNLIKSITWIHQYQRIQFEYNGKNILIASPEDFYNALTIGKDIFDQSLSGLEPRLQEVIDSYLKLRQTHVNSFIDDTAPDLDWVERTDLQKDLDLCRDTIKSHTEELSDLNIFRIFTKSNRVYIALAEKDSPTNLPTINPLITHDKKHIYNLINQHYPRILEEGVVGKSGVDFSLEYTKSCFFSPRKSLPTKKAKNTYIGGLKQQLNSEKSKNRGLESWVIKKQDIPLHDKIKESSEYLEEHKENNFDHVEKILGEHSLKKMIKEGLFEEVIPRKTLRYLGGS